MILSNKHRKKLILIDGSSYLYRAFYALPNLKNSAGENTGAIHGVINMINKLIQTHDPNHIVVIFDAKGKNFRHKIYKDYKGTRKAMPDELKEQVQPIIDFIQSLGIKVIQIDGVEADDVIATLARKFSNKDEKVLISSGDKDLAQLVSENIELVNSFDNKLLDKKAIKEKFGVTPNKIFDYLVLIGDKSDNVPGVDKVGPKTAIDLIEKYKSLDGIIKNINKLKGKLYENLSNSLDKIEIAKKLIKLKDDVSINENLEDFSISNRDEKELYKLASRYELTNIAKKLSIQSNINEKQTESIYKKVQSKEDFYDLIEKLNKNKIFSFDTETTSLEYLEAEIVGVSFSIKPYEAYYIPISHTNTSDNLKIEKDEFFKILKKLLENKNNKIICQNIKYEMHVLTKYNIQFTDNIEDTMILSYVYNSTGRHDLDTLSKKYLNHETIKYEDVVGKGSSQLNFSDVEIESASNYACEDADITLRLYNYLNNQLKNLSHQKKLYEKIENPLIPVITKMEEEGIMIDSLMLKKHSEKLGKELNKIEKEIYILAGTEFNISSPKQLQEIFYNKLKLKVIKKTPTGQPSTNEDVMQELSEKHKLPKFILQYRNLLKLKNTYTDKLGNQVNSITNRLHTSYNQTVTITGRLSSSNPNLQNIPIRTDEGRKIRSAFISNKNFKIISADYSQIELRVMAHLSKDKNLIKNFVNGDDVHAFTAKEVFNLNTDPTNEERRAAKAINFGLIYGISTYGLAKQLKIENDDAKKYIDSYFKKYKEIKKFMENVKSKTKENGYIDTLMGRRVFVPNITHSNYQIRSAAERTAINAPIQGTAADILKIAMINIHDWIKNSKHDIRMIMQVHDELVFEIIDKDIDICVENIKYLMSNCVKLDVPLTVDIGIGNNWDEAH
tara:strand:+ start:819 stop:3512 length:2694 start_codon:yes stop_codon:yes gene_type:complete